MSTCKRCDATIKWVTLDTGRRVPVDPIGLHHRGNIAAWSSGGGRLAGHFISKAKPHVRGLRYTLHAIACKDVPLVTAAERTHSLLDQEEV